MLDVNQPDIIFYFIDREPVGQYGGSAAITAPNDMSERFISLSFQQSNEAVTRCTCEWTGELMPLL